MGCSIVALKVATLVTAVIHKISFGAGGKNTLSPEESFRGSVSFGELRSHAIDCAREYACHYGGEDNKERIQ